MRRPSRRLGLLIVAGGFLICPSRAWAGAWTVPRNRWYAEYFYRYFRAEKDFDHTGDSSRKTKAGVSTDIRNEWKLEYGLTDWWNLLASVPYQSAHFRDDSTDLLNANVGDIYVRTKFRFLQQPVVSSLQFSWKIPSAYNPNESPGLGDGQVDFESRLQVSRAWTFRPYDVAVHHRHPRGRAVHGRSQSKATRPESRDEAMRDAVLTAELYARGHRLFQQGRYWESAKWLRAVLVQDPSHREAQRLLFEAATAAQEALASLWPHVQTVSEERIEPLPADDDGETETRYAGVAFVNLEGAFTARNEDPANEFPLVLEAGITPFKRLMVVGSLESTLSIRSTHEQVENFAKWGIRGILNVWGDGFSSIFRGGGPTVNVEVGYNDVVAGRNTADAFEIFGKIGVFF